MVLSLTTARVAAKPWIVVMMPPAAVVRRAGGVAPRIVARPSAILAGMFIPPAGYALSAYTPPPLGAVEAPPPILADRFDTKTGDISTLIEGDDPTDAALQWQFTIRQGSGAAIGDNGNRLHEIRKATDSAPIQIEDEGRRVVQKFERRGDIKDVSVSGAVVGESTAIAALEVRCRNVHTGRMWPEGR